MSFINPQRVRLGSKRLRGKTQDWTRRRESHQASEHTPLIQERPQRLARVASAVAQGGLIAPDDMRIEEGYYVRAHHGHYRALALAHQLSATQYRFLMTVLEYSYGMSRRWVVRDFKGTPPTTADWLAWLNIGRTPILCDTAGLAAHGASL